MTAEPFAAFDPLEVKNQPDSSFAAQRAVRREIQNILSSYVGWYDPFCELVQNALDAVDRRLKDETHAGTQADYTPTVRVLIDLENNSLTVSDNGTGMSAEEFRQFLAPNFSFKEEKTSRGHKGVGATYLAYGFNYLRVHTRQPGHESCGRLLGARDWTESELGTQPPLVEPDDAPDGDTEFAEWARGTTMTVVFDEHSQPRQLSWLSARDAQTWLKILRVRTGIGSVFPDSNKCIEVVCKDVGTSTVARMSGTEYLWLHEEGGKSAQMRDLIAARAAAFEKHGDPRRVPGKFMDLAFVYDQWTAAEVPDLLSEEDLADHKDVIERHKPTVQFEYGYTTRLWARFNDGLGIRSNMNVVRPGIQLAANQMPQGDVTQVPLTRYVGRQNQVHFLIHFEDYTPDLGRKGFSKPLVDFATALARSVVQNRISGLRSSMKKDSGAAPDLGRQLKLEEWKEEMVKHEQDFPLTIDSDHFFLPTRKISITSQPTREQDVIALFHEMLSGGVIRGLRVMATNERLTYDSLFKVSFAMDREVYEYDASSNPLGLEGTVLDALWGSETKPLVLEYKYSLDGLMNDLDAQEKNINDVDLCVAWEIGQQWEEKYGITTLLVPENISQREFHGATHILQDPDSRARQATLIILKDLVESLVDPAKAQAEQRERYE